MSHIGWRMIVTVGCVTPVIALAGCWPFSSDSKSNRGAPTPAATPAATSAAPVPAGIGGDYCAIVLKENTAVGTMVDEKYVPTDQWTHAQVVTLVDFAVAHGSEIVAGTPPELKSAVQVVMQWWQAIKDAGYNMSGAEVPPGFFEAAKQMTSYEKNVCGFINGT